MLCGYAEKRQSGTGPNEEVHLGAWHCSCARRCRGSSTAGGWGGGPGYRSCFSGDLLQVEHFISVQFSALHYSRSMLHLQFAALLHQSLCTSSFVVLSHQYWQAMPSSFRMKGCCTCGVLVLRWWRVMAILKAANLYLNPPNCKPVSESTQHPCGVFLHSL